MKNHIKVTIGISIVICLIASIAICSWNVGNFDKVHIVESKEEALKTVNVSIPKEIVISTKFYSKTVITSKLKINDILESINPIIKHSYKNNEILENDNSVYTIHGKIYYNNKVDEFSLNNELIFNGKRYVASSYKINLLHRKLFKYFNTYKHLLDILKTNRSVVYLIQNSREKDLCVEDKEKLICELKDLKQMSNKEKLDSTSIKDKKLYTYKIKINYKVDNKTNNLVYIDVYKDYIIVQFLADDNGEKIYMKGAINNV